MDQQIVLSMTIIKSRIKEISKILFSILNKN